MELFKILPVKILIYNDSDIISTGKEVCSAKLASRAIGLQKLANYSKEIEKEFSLKKVERPSGLIELKEKIRITINIKDIGCIFGDDWTRTYTEFSADYISSGSRTSMIWFFHKVNIENIPTHDDTNSFVKNTLSEFDDWVKEIIKSSVKANQSNRQKS